LHTDKCKNNFIISFLPPSLPLPPCSHLTPKQIMYLQKEKQLCRKIICHMGDAEYTGHG